MGTHVHRLYPMPATNKNTHRSECLCIYSSLREPHEKVLSIQLYAKSRCQHKTKTPAQGERVSLHIKEKMHLHYTPIPAQTKTPASGETSVFATVYLEKEPHEKVLSIQLYAKS